MTRKQRALRLILTFTVAIPVAAAAVAWTTGPADLSEYPPSENSPYRLPFEAGTARWCVQGNRSLFSHRGRVEYSFDFLMPVGTSVVAARDGIVAEVEVSRSGIGNFPGNRIVIMHADGTRAFYVHLRQGGSVVEVGDSVSQGQVIGSSGSTGRSLYPHLHFHVESEGASIPVSFADVERHRGVPRAGAKYVARQ